ncbi:hypothetical protein C2E23DRAFT_888591 [Lenzites betulinus]|nr:hypothetical protein C2E23DRAFT_888591 [Lenzites betulinus]
MTVALRDASYSEASWRPAVRDRLLYRTTTKNDGFAIPTDLRRSTMHARTSSKAQQARIEALQAEVNEIQSVLNEGENAEQIVSRHIKSLHQYNEAKDAAQQTLFKEVG